ncbi:hypothetical protein DI005_12670 [Prauserella sp. PE36]|nr:hypothetical protein DI005_12670 [Prauserella sp. PE36]
MLGDLGAEVTKVEPPGRDGGRLIRGELFAAANRNKHGVVIDLKTLAGQAEFLDLAREHDVLVEGFRPGVMNELGVGTNASPRSIPASCTAPSPATAAAASNCPATTSTTSLHPAHCRSAGAGARNHAEACRWPTSARRASPHRDLVGPVRTGPIPA